MYTYKKKKEANTCPNPVLNSTTEVFRTKTDV